MQEVWPKKSWIENQKILQRQLITFVLSAVVVLLVLMIPIAMKFKEVGSSAIQVELIRNQSVPKNELKEALKEALKDEPKIIKQSTEAQQEILKVKEFKAKVVIPKRNKPVFANEFKLSTRTDIDKPLIIGAILFGIGWGMAGYCPGPAIATLGTGGWDSAIFLISMILGSMVQRYLYTKKESSVKKNLLLRNLKS